MTSICSLERDDEAKSVDDTKYKGMIGSLLYLTDIQEDIIFGVCKLARFQYARIEYLLTAINHNIHHLVRKSSFGLWYPKEKIFLLEGFVDADYACDTDETKSTSSTHHILGNH